MGLSSLIRSRLLATSFLVAAGSIYNGYGQQAMAGSCSTPDAPPAALTVTCTGATNAADVTQTFTSPGGITITDDAAFGLDTTTTGGHGIVTSGGNSIINLFGDVKAELLGINSTVFEAGAITSIQTSGTIESTNSAGIRARLGASSSLLGISNLTSGTIIAEEEGIFARNEGSGAPTNILNSGTITTNTSHGIYFDHGGATDVGNTQIVNQATGIITTLGANGDGIAANHSSDFSLLRVTNLGRINATKDGIQANPSGNTVSTIVRNLGNITATMEGIDVDVNGQNNTIAITNSATLISNTTDAISASVTGISGQLTVTNAMDAIIQGSTNGIDVIHVTTTGGDAVVNNFGQIGVLAGDGLRIIISGIGTSSIDANNGSAGTISATGFGILTQNDAPNGETFIDNSGTISSTGSTGIAVETGSDSSDVQITNLDNGFISAQVKGISADVEGTNATTTITNNGLITTTFEEGITVNADDDTGDVIIINNTDSTITSQLTGISTDVKGAGARTFISNGGLIRGAASHGIKVLSDNDTGEVVVGNAPNAEIQVEHNAIQVEADGAGAMTTIRNGGKLTSRSLGGINVRTNIDTADVLIENVSTGEIDALGNGIEARVNGNLALTQVLNAGSITSSNNQGIFIDAGDITVDVEIYHEATGSINARLSGIYAEVTNNFTTTITSQGEITSTNGAGITYFSNAAVQDSTIIIDVTGDITAAASSGIHLLDSSNAPKHTATITINDATINSDRGIELQVGDQSEVAITIGANAKVLSTDTAIVDFEIGGGMGAKTNALLLGEIDGSVALRGNDDTFIMRGPQASVGAGTNFINGGDGTDAFTFDNVQIAAGSTFDPDLGLFATIELMNGSLIRVDGINWGGDHVIINAGNTLHSVGTSGINSGGLTDGNLVNNGTLTLADGTPDDVFSVRGELSGSGTFVLDANLDATELSDRIEVDGNIDAASAHMLVINDLTGIGAATGNGDTDGILVVEANAAAVESNYSLAGGPIIAGIFTYDLHMSAGNDFFLQSRFVDSASVIPSAIQGSTLGADALMQGYLTRHSSRIEAPISSAPAGGEGGSFAADLAHASDADPTNKYWLRLLGSHGEYEGRLTAGGALETIETDADFGGVQMGVDFALPDYPDSYATFWGHYLYQENDVYNQTTSSAAGGSTIRSGGVGLGITYDPGTGMYFDALGSISFSQADNNAASGVSGDTRGMEYFASAEMGYRFQTGYGNLSFIPQVQVKTHIAEFDNYIDSTGTSVTNLDSNRSTVRLGLSLEDHHQMSNGGLRLMGTLSWSDVFSSETRADLLTTRIDLSDADEFLEGTLGFEYTMDDNSSIWGSINHKSGLGDLDSENTGLALGFSIKF